ncbi:thioredoxin-like protein [Pavlovales sp. CCMP2436]|nr:thioredoxin-like protein [Pavlovales sp. CCMP2436]
MAFGLLIASFAFAPLARVAPSNRPVSRLLAGSHSLSMSIPDKINKLVSQNDVVVFSKSFCPFCAKTKALFKEMNVKAEVLELDLMDDGSEYQSELLKMTSQKSVPNVFVKGAHLGGNDDTQKARSSGKLAELLAA